MSRGGSFASLSPQADLGQQECAKTTWFVIEKDVPLPKQDARTGRAGNVLRYPWNLLEVGDSVVVPDESHRAVALNWAARNGRAFTSRKQRGGWRLWRTV